MNPEIALHNAAVLAAIKNLEAAVKVFANAAEKNNTAGWEYIDPIMLRESLAGLDTLKEYVSAK